MKKHLYKIFSCLLALVMIVGFGFVLSACKDDDPVNPDINSSRIVNLTTGPSVEFVLDKEDKVLTSNANNAEGNFVVANVNFIGKTIDEALEMFLDFNKQNGFISAKEDEFSNKLKIEISGNKGLELYGELVLKAQNYFDENDIEAAVSFSKITKAKLFSLVIESSKEEEFVLRMNEQQLIEIIRKSRLETANIYSQELKNLYYEFRYQEILKAKFDAIKVQIDNLEKLPELGFIERLLGINLSEYTGQTVEERFVDYINEKISLFEAEMESFKSSYIDLILKNEEYKTAFNNYIEAQQTLLEAKLNNSSTPEEIENLKELLEEAKINFYGDSEGNNLGEEKAFVTKVQEFLGEEKQKLSDVQKIVESAINQMLYFLDEKEVNDSVEMVKNNTLNLFINDEEIKTLVENSKIFWNNLKPDVE